MRVLGIGDWNDLGDLYLQLQREGHAVRVHIADPTAHDILDGLIQRVHDWRDHLGWVREVGEDGVIVFETAHHGRLQDELRSAGYQVIGGCAFGDRLEADRAYGQQIMCNAGMKVLPSWSFTDAHEAAQFVLAHPARYVLKWDATADVVCSTYVGRSPDGADVAALLRMRTCRPTVGHKVAVQNSAGHPSAGHQPTGRLLLTLHVEGIEVGVGAYFNGQRFLTPACIDWEHKRFFPGGIGELTGEMGTLATFHGAQPLFERTLARFASELRAAGYVGYINLNTIIDERGIWPLEFTCRFGYPGFALLGTLQRDGWSDLFRRLLDPAEKTFSVTADYAVGVVITVPPFPYPDGYERLSKGAPVIVLDRRPEDDAHLHLAEVASRDGALVCSGQIGYPLVVSGTGRDAESARDAAYARVLRVVIPDMRYRQDIGESFIARDRETLSAWGYLADESRLVR